MVRALSFGMNQKVGGSSPPQVDIFSVLKTSTLSQNIRSWVEKECCCPHTVNNSNVNFTTKTSMLALKLSMLVKAGARDVDRDHWRPQASTGLNVLKIGHTLTKHTSEHNFKTIRIKRLVTIYRQEPVLWISLMNTLENRYGFWPQTGCVTVPGREAAFLVARQRFPYRSRFNFSVKNMENMLLWNAICDIMHIDFNRKMYCGANDASIHWLLIEVH